MCVLEHAEIQNKHLASKGAYSAWPVLGWRMFYVSESPHKDRSKKVCVCVF